MRKLSLKLRVGLICAAVAAAVMLCAAGLFLWHENAMMKNYYRNLLRSTSQLACDSLRNINGRLEADRNLNRLQNVQTAVYRPDGTLLYGRTRFEAPFAPGELGSGRSYDGSLWYYFDTMYTSEDGTGAVIRCSAQADAADRLSSIHLSAAAILLPVVCLIAGLAGALAARHSIRQVNRLAAEIEDIASGDDLDRELPLGANRDEFHRLNDAFNRMLSRLKASFDREARFSGDVSHELRTPIASILNQTEYALSPGSGEKDMRDALVSVQGTARDMRTLTEKLLELSRMESDSYTIDREVFDLSELCEICAEGCGAEAGARNATIEVRADSPLEINADQSLLTQTVLNLINNSIRYGKEGGHVLVEARLEGGDAVIRVSDDGPGMSGETKEHAFERFYRADGSRRSPGSGLGLPFVKRMTELHSGTVEIESGPGKGTAVTIRLPAAADE